MSIELASALDTWNRKRAFLTLLAGYLVTRLFAVMALWIASSSQASTGPSNDFGPLTPYFVHTEGPASPGLVGVLANWDGQWYERIAMDGYPSGAEAHSSGDAIVWQFPPLFPLASRCLMFVTGLNFPLAAVLLNLVLGGIATVLLYGIFRSVVSISLALAGALSVNVFMTAPLFDVAYSEPAALVFLLLALREIMARRYAIAMLPVLALAFTRPVAAPLALVFVVHWWSRSRSRNAMLPSWGTHIVLGLCTVVSLASPFLWSVIAALWLRDPQAITQTSGPISGSARAAWMLSSFDFGWFHRAHDAAGWPGTSFLVLVVLVGLGFPVAAARRLKLPVELQVWAVGYVLFVLLVTPVTPGFLRYLLLVAPLLTALPMWMLTRRPKRLGVAAFSLICAAGLWTQWFWIRYVYILDPAPALVPWAP